MNENEIQPQKDDMRTLIRQARNGHRMAIAIEPVCDALERMIAWREQDREVAVSVSLDEHDKASALAAKIALAIEDKYGLNFSILVIPNG